MRFFGPEPACGVSWSTGWNCLHKQARQNDLYILFQPGLFKELWGNPQAIFLPLYCLLLHEGNKKPIHVLYPSSCLLMRIPNNLGLVLTYSYFGQDQFRKHIAKLGIFPGNTSCRLCGPFEDTVSSRHFKRAVERRVTPGGSVTWANLASSWDLLIQSRVYPRGILYRTW